MGHFKLNMRPAVYDREPKRGNAATWFALLIVSAIIIGATMLLLTGYDAARIEYFLASVRLER